MNLGSVDYWSTEDPMIDRFHTAGPWVAKDASGTNVSAKLVFDADGDPTNLNGVSSLSVAVSVDPKSAAPVDEYVLTYDGTAGAVSIANAKIVSQSAGKVVFDFTGGDIKPYVAITFSQLQAGDPVGDVHVVRTDQQALFNAGEIFNPEFVAKVSQWGVVRFMDWENTNASATVNWATRSTLSDGSWAGNVNDQGVPLEAMVKLANEAHVDLWYNVPTKADDTYVTNALTYIRDHLDSGLKVNVEYSNEVWNSGFAANGYAKSQAAALWGGGADVDHGANVFYGYRSAQIANIAHQVFTGTHAGQAIDVLAGQASNPALMPYMLQGVAKAALGTASALFQDYAVAPYFGGELSAAGATAADRAIVLKWAKSGAAGLTAAFHELEFGGSLSKDSSLAAVNAWLVQSGAVAKAAGLDLVAYEGGASLASARFPTGNQAAVQTFFGTLMNDPRMGDLYTKLIADMKSAGGTEFVAYNDVSSNSSSGYWGALDSIYDTGSPRYDALLAAAKADTVSTVPSAGDDDILAGLTGGKINALAGNDTVTAGPASDTIFGGDGNDVIIGASGSVNAQGQLIERDSYNGGAGADTIVGGLGNDHIYGNESTSVAGAADGNDSLSGGGGIDQIHGNGGNDTISGGDDGDQLHGDEGNDVINGDAANDHLWGDAGNDTLSGGTGNDIVEGGDGDDRLSGDDGDDKLLGGLGHDVMTGGAGRDQFIFGVGDAAFVKTGATAYVMDEVTDFTPGSDKLSLGFHPAAILAGSAATVSAATSWATQALHAKAGVADVATVTVGTDVYLFYDDHGAGGALDAGIRLDHLAGTTLTPTNFV